ncbi:60S ribosomal export protein NMD3 [Mycena indigotica]|uniref:60S ribosomal export protein NMD3 n=1 Tax=Mycena indigotica TaxID=2126181 RepID=A0A8H6SK22_9AGAR|nr:60S ribosomal export protein NMD3 [Mycena indigotica]KAF7301145.1 60S ribosomal export protein NMD3 [Mycena indigotica]
MEFVPGPAVHQILCADCGIIEHRLRPTRLTSALLACVTRESVLSGDVWAGNESQYRYYGGYPKARRVDTISIHCFSINPFSIAASVAFCRNCERFLSPPQTWTLAQPESPELLSICLRKLKGLNKVRLTEAHFIWTEPHSKRLRVSITIQKEVLINTILEQTFELEYLVQYGQCPDCARLAAKNTWKALVQVRQKVPHKRTFLFLEQLILKHNAQKDTISVKEVKDGLDFFYSQRSHAIKMVEFLTSVVPVRSKSSEQLLSSDTHSNTANYKFTYSVEIAPVCKDDLVCIPSKLARSMSNIHPLTICTRIGNSLQLLDPTTLQIADVSTTSYWRTPFDSLAAVTDLVEFTVLDIEPDGRTRGKYVMADAQVALAGAFRAHGEEDDVMMDDESYGGRAAQIFHTRTHLGAILQPGDTAFGYHLTNANFNSEDYAALRAEHLPDVVLVKKAYPNRRKKSKARTWRLRSIGKEAGEEGETGGGRGVVGRMGGRDQRKVEEDYEMFLRELEEDPEMRGAINLYKAPVQDARMAPATTESRAAGRKGGKRKAQFAMEVDAAPAPERTTDSDGDVDNEADFPDVRLDELLENFDDLTLGTSEEFVPE